MKMNCIIVDDEEASRHVLRELLRKFCPDVSVIGEAGDAGTAFKLIERLSPDLVFLDIQMPVVNGFSLLKKFKKISFDVIFVTSFNQYAINAIRFNALDYLLKPTEVADLIHAVERASERQLEKMNNAPLVVNLLDNVDKDQADKKLPVHVPGGVRLISISEISFIEADSNYCRMVLTNKDKLIVARTLKDMEDTLSEIRSMIRISKSVIVNSAEIAGYTKQEPCIITLRSGRQFEVSRRKKQEVLRLLL